MNKCLTLLILFTISCASTSDKRISMVHTQIGTKYLKEKRFPQAFREFFTAVDLDPENDYAHNHLGLTYILANRFEMAETHLNKALEINPKYTDAKVNYAYLLLEKKDYAQALKKLKLAGEDLTYTKQHKILALKGRAYFYLNDFKKAQIHLREAILKERKYCPAHRFFGPSLVLSGENERAIKAIEHALSLCNDEQFEELYYYGALAYFQKGDYARSKAKLKELRANHPNGQYKKDAKKLADNIASVE